MGAPSLLGGATFEVDERSIVPVEECASFWRRHPNPAAFAILSAVVPELRRAGYETTEARRGKPDDVRCQCTVRSGYIELILVAEEGSRSTLRFFLMAWAFCRVQVTEERARAWQQVSTITGGVIRNRFGGTSLAWLSPREVDARFAAKPDVG